jgi:hypothetical protein
MRFISLGKVFTGAALATALLVAPDRADAQLANTGQVNNAPQDGCNGLFCDAKWSVYYGDITERTVVGPNQYREFATGVNPATMPSPPWAANRTDAGWISVNQEATLPGAGTTGESLVRYFFTQSFLSTTGTVSFDLGWDNVFKGIYVNAIGVDGIGAGYGAVGGTFFSASDLGVSGVSGEGFPANRRITISGLTEGQMNSLWIEVEGDGTTDALFLADATQVVPEPAPIPSTPMALT